MKEASKEEFDKFIEEYKSKLVENVIFFTDPPSIQYNDFSDGKVWPDSVVASYYEAIDLSYKKTGEIKYKIKGSK